MEEELVKMSLKGQLVVPKEIRSREKFKPTDRFIAFGVKDGVLFRRVNMPNVKAAFESLSEEISKQFKEKKIEEKDVEEAIRWAKQKRH